MNGYELTRRLKETRLKTPLSANDQALFYELVSICNEKMWEESFYVKTSQLVSSLQLSYKTILKSRKTLVDAGLITFTTPANNRLGCLYSLNKSFINIDSTCGINTGVKELSTEVTYGIDTEVNPSTYGTAPQVSPSPPTIYNKTVYIKHKDNTPACKSSSTKNKKNLQRDKRDLRTLDYPYTSEAFMSVWEELAETAKWRTKKNGSLQRSLNKLGKYEEAFAIEQMERAIECNWMGVVFPNTDKFYEEWKMAKEDGYGRNNKPEKKSAGIVSFEF